MSKKLSILLLTMVVLTISIYNVTNIIFANNTDIASSAKAMAVIEGYTNTLLYSHNSDQRLAMASTTKIVTAIVAIENTIDFDTPFRVSDNAIGIEGTSIYLQEGEMMSMNDLLLGLILASGNDCAVAIAEHFGYDNFMTKMNELPSKLGLSNTHFDNPHGLDSDTHYTTAYDLAVITNYALDNEKFREIVSTKRAIISGNGVTNDRYLKHKNKLLFSMDNCVGVKTGFTDNAGRCLVNAHEENGMRIVSVVLNCGPMFDECKRLTELALAEYEVKEFVSPYAYVADVTVNNGDKNKVSLVSIKEYSKAIRIEDKSRYSVKYDIPDSIDAPVELNSAIGKVYVCFDGEPIFTDDIYAIDSTKNIDIKHILDEIILRWQ